MNYDDDRPGVMRVHIAQQRAAALCKFYTRDELREIAKARGIHTAHRHRWKRDLAVALAFAGVVTPTYDKAAER